MQRQLAPRAFEAPFLCTTTNETEPIFMSELIPKRTRVRKTWLAGLSRALTVSDVGVAFLSAQITDLEERCAAMRRRINRERRESTPARRAQTA